MNPLRRTPEMVPSLDREYAEVGVDDAVPVASNAPSQAQKHEPSDPPTRGQHLIEWLNPTRIGGVYALIGLIVIFSIWLPSTFPNTNTIYQIANSNAITALAALTLVIPLAAGVFDISIVNTMNLSGVVTTYAIAIQGSSILVGVLAGLGVSLLVGLLNACVVVLGRIESLVATLATGFLIQAVVLWRTNSQTVNGAELQGDFQNLAYGGPFGNFSAAVLYALVACIMIWLILEHTATGRRIYATGFNREAARLATVRTDRLQFGALIASSLMAGATGILIAASLGSGSPTAAVSYLLPAFAGVFVGATQFRPGRFNAWGTVLAVVLLGTLTTGLGLASVPQWTQQMATGAVLIVALVGAARGRKNAGVQRRRPRAARVQATTP